MTSKVYSVVHSDSRLDPEVEVFGTYEEATDYVRDLFEQDVRLGDRIDSKSVAHDDDENITCYTIVFTIEGHKIIRQAKMKRHILG